MSTEINPNPYVNADGSPRILNSVVVFVDILGYKSMAVESINHSTSSDFLDNLIVTMEDMMSWIAPDEGTLWSGKYLYKTKSFTDNIVIGYPVRDDGEWELGHIFHKLSVFQLNMINRGFFVRGGISIGPLYIDDNIVFGQGLIDAHHIESKISRDPRIVLSDTATKAVQEHMEYYALPESSPQNQILLKDPDDKLFINYLDSILIAADERGPYFEELFKHKEEIERHLDKHRNNPYLWSKYSWAANYHNYFCDSYRYFDSQHKIDISKFLLVPRRIV